MFVYFGTVFFAITFMLIDVYLTMSISEYFELPKTLHMCFNSDYKMKEILDIKKTLKTLCLFA